MREMRASLKGCREHPERLRTGMLQEDNATPQPKKARATKVKEDRGSMDDWDYEVPGQMELSDFIEMPEGGNDDD